jgi:hypothetical protein
MKRPVRPIALVILTLCMVYPGVTMLYQGLYPFVAGEYFSLVARLGPWMDLATKLHIPPVVVLGLKSAVGVAWLAGVLGLWAGDGRALPLVLLAAAGSLLYPVGPSVMGVIALVVLFAFRENDRVVPA